MSISEFEDYEYLLALLKFNTAPTVYCNKVGTLVNLQSSKRDLKNCYLTHSTSFERILKLDSIILKQSDNSLLVYFYKPESLRHRLTNPKVKDFLSDRGYIYDDFSESLITLKLHFNTNNCPCEIGIFLGYPLEDVKAFMEKRCDCKCVGYWKCYNNAVTSKLKFFIYDLMKWFVVQQASFKRAPLT